MGLCSVSYTHLDVYKRQVQEAVDLTYDSFELAERDRNPVLVLLDGSLGSVMEEVEFPQAKPVPPRPDWAVGNFNGGTHPQRIVASMGSKELVEQRSIRNGKLLESCLLYTSVPRRCATRWTGFVQRA